MQLVEENGSTKTVEEFKIIPYKQRPDKQDAIICDLDGTLALRTHRSPYDLTKVDTDMLNYPVYWLVEAIKLAGLEVAVLIVSGREDVCENATLDWLNNNNVNYDALFMRSEGDGRKDYEVKYEIFNEEIRNEYNVILTIDDRNQVVNMWRELGLTCLQVAEGDF